MAAWKDTREGRGRSGYRSRSGTSVYEVLVWGKGFGLPTIHGDESPNWYQAQSINSVYSLAAAWKDTLLNHRLGGQGRLCSSSPSRFRVRPANSFSKDIMRRKRIIRPKADVKKIHCKNEFELCYLRHQYFRKVDFNPTIKDMAPYQKISAKLASNTFFTYRPLLVMVGLEREDVINIANVHLVSFLGLFSLEKMPQKYEEFVGVFTRYQFQKPRKTDILDKNKANYTLFLKQRMEDLVRICRQKAKNIKGLTADGFFYCYGSATPPKKLSDLIKNYDSLGFKKLDAAVFKSIRKRAGIRDENVFLIGEKYYIAVPIEKKSLTVEDLNGADMNPRDTLHSMTPEDIYFTLEESNVWVQRQETFDNKPMKIKANIIKNFINKNRDKKNFREEVQTAKRLLKELE